MSGMILTNEKNHFYRLALMILVVFNFLVLIFYDHQEENKVHLRKLQEKPSNKPILMDKYLVTEPSAGLWNQLMTISDAMVMANLTGRNVLVLGMKTDHMLGYRVNASDIIDLEYLTNYIVPRMGIVRPSFSVKNFDNRYVPGNCNHKAKMGDDAALVYEWLESVENECETVNIGFNFFSHSSNAEHKFHLVSNIDTLYRYLQFSPELTEFALYLQTKYISTCSNALVVHFRMEDDILQAPWTASHFRLNKSNTTSGNHHNELRNLLVRGFIDLSKTILDNFPTNCVYICTNAHESYLKQFKNELLETRPHLVIAHNPLNTDNLLIADEQVKLFFEKFKMGNHTSLGRELRGAIDFLIASHLGGTFIGANCSTFSKALASRFADKHNKSVSVNTVHFIENYLDAVHRNQTRLARLNFLHSHHHNHSEHSTNTSIKY